MNTRTSVKPWVTIGAGLLGLALATGCAPKTGRRQTSIMEQSGAVSMSAFQLRARVNDLADRLAARLEETADRIRAEATDRAVRRRALAFKLDGVTAIYVAAFRADPLASAMDVWALTFQITHYVEYGAGRDAFGPQQSLAQQGARALLADADAAMADVANRPEAFDKARARVASWASRNPVGHTFSPRLSMAAYLAEFSSEDRDAFAAVGEAATTVHDVSERLNVYAALLPRQARWQAELLVSETTGEHDLEGTLGDIQAVGVMARHADELLGDVPGLVASSGAPVRELVAAERLALLEGVDRQRLATLEYLTAERLAVLAALRGERIAVVEALRQERIEALKEVDAIGGRTVEAAVRGLQGLVDHAFWRLTALVVVAMVTAFVLGVAGYWLTLRRGRAGGNAGRRE